MTVQRTRPPEEPARVGAGAAEGSRARYSWKRREPVEERSDDNASSERAAAGRQPARRLDRGGVPGRRRAVRRPGLRAAGRRDGTAARRGSATSASGSSGRTRTSRPCRRPNRPTGIPRHAYETPVFKVRDGVAELHWDTWPRIDDAIASYEMFRALRDEGVIPSHLRFQIGLPFPSSALNGFKADFAADYAIAGPAFEDLVRRELERLTRRSRPRTSRSSGTSATRCSTSRASSPGWATARWERFTGPVGAADPADPRGRARRLPPLLRHVPGVADVRGARHGPPRAHGEPRRRGLRAHRRLAAPGRARATCAARTTASSAAVRPRARRHARLPRDRAAARRRSPASSGGTDRVEITSTTSAWRCTAGSAASRRRRRWRRCASTAASSRRFAPDRDQATEPAGGSPRTRGGS